MFTERNKTLIAVLLIGSVTLTLASCFSLSDDTGLNTLVKETSNARKDKKVILFRKESTLSYDSYQVTVCDNNHELDKGEVGNTFTVDSNRDSTFLDAESINFTWLGNDTLEIDYDKKLRAFIQNKEVNNTTIVYKAR